MESSTSELHELASAANWLASESVAVQNDFLDGLEPQDILALPYIFEFWAMPHQLPPEGNWLTWALVGGRGAGKTRAGSEWVRARVEGAKPHDPGISCRVGLIGETVEQAREVMVFGESGLLACSPPDRRPEWIAGRRMLVWPNGATAEVLSAHDPEALRGRQFDAVWADELAKWKRGQEAWDMIQFGLRLGDNPRACVTTTPRNCEVLRDLLLRPSTAISQAATWANRANLAASFLDEVKRRYAGTRLGEQELEGVILTEAEGSLWSTEMLEKAQAKVAPDLDRIVVAVDPPVTGQKTSDDCGIVVVGVESKGAPQGWRAWVLEDATVSAASPLEWAQAAIAAYHRHNAERIVAEVNQGGSLVETVLRQIDPLIPFKAVRATRGKVARAEPAAALYEQGRVKHLRGLGQLEGQMALITAHGYEGRGSPDRVDALVWGLHETMIAPTSSWRQPRFRSL